MARPKSPDARTETLAVRVSKATAKVIDAERGDATRAEWLGTLIAEALTERVRSGMRPGPPAPPPEVVAEAIVPLEGDGRARKRKAAAVPRDPEVPVAVFAPPPALEEPEEPDARERSPENCKHAKAARKGGRCPDCRAWVPPRQ